MMRVLFVCTGNICRSPTAAGVLRALAQRAGLAGDVEVDSAGLEDWHVGEPPDPRSIAHAQRRGYDLSGMRGRRFAPEDFARHDWVVAMDEGHWQRLAALCTPGQRHKLRRARDFCLRTPADVADPYEGGEREFEQALDCIEDVCAGLLQALQASCRPGGRGPANGP